MKWISAGLGLGIFLAARPASADEKFPILKAGDDVYTNVTITSVTVTDVYFTHAGGMGNAKLKNLDAAMQAHFHFNVTNASVVEEKQIADTAQFKRDLLAAEADRKTKLPPKVQYEDGDAVAPKMFAKSFRGQRAPSITVDRWLTQSPPNPEGKFVLVFLWITSAQQCRNCVPQINGFAEKFRDKMITVGLSNESVEEMLKMKEPAVHFYAGTDTQSRTFLAFEVSALPHVVLIDPAGIVRFEGPPIYLDEKNLLHLLNTYKQ